VDIFKNPDALAAAAAELVIDAAREAIELRGRFTLVLSGSSTPEKTYMLLADPARSGAIDWAHVYLFFGDERLVPVDDPGSNFGMARRSLLARAPVSRARVFPMPTSESSPEVAATAYSLELARFFAQQPDSDPPPRFDLILLGLGDDGHTASLFPGQTAEHVQDKWVTWSPPGVLPPPVDRLTLTLPVLNSARHAVFLVAGEKKADVLKAILEGGADSGKYPASRVAPPEGTLTWLVDEAAAFRIGDRGAHFTLQKD
jgi:6-phosphogluconolactonase